MTGDVEHLARSGRASDRAAAAGHSDATPERLAERAADPSAAVRRVVASRGLTPTPALRRLARDPDRRTRLALVENRSCPPGALLVLADDDHWSVRWRVPDHPLAADHQLQTSLAANNDPVVRGLLAERHDLSPAVARRLCADPMPDVRHRLATHTRDEQVVALLLEDDAPAARAGLALNDGMLTDDLADRLSLDPSWQVRATLANARRKLPAQVYDRLSTDRSQAVRDLLAHNPATPERWLRLLAEDESPDIAHDVSHRLDGKLP